MKLVDKLKIYYVGSVLGVLFAVIGFSYNAWRLESTEDNNNIRMASFAILTEPEKFEFDEDEPIQEKPTPFLKKELAELEQIIYAAHYDKNEIEGSPRKGWVKVGLIVDLSSLINKPVKDKAELLKLSWGNNWNAFTQNRNLTDKLIKEIETVRKELKSTLTMLD